MKFYIHETEAEKALFIQDKMVYNLEHKIAANAVERGAKKLAIAALDDCKKYVYNANYEYDFWLYDETFFTVFGFCSSNFFCITDDDTAKAICNENQYKAYQESHQMPWAMPHDIDSSLYEFSDWNEPRKAVNFLIFEYIKEARFNAFMEYKKYAYTF